MNYVELFEHHERVKERLRDMRETGVTQLRATIAEQAQMLGIDLKDLVPKKKRQARKRKEDEV